MSVNLQQLVQQLDLEQLEVNLFRGQSADLGGRSVFGGQVIGQALVAAARTIGGETHEDTQGREPHSLHAYFLLPGDMSKPIIYQVDAIRDGRSFSARRVQAIQHGRPILSMIASFQVVEPGLDHQLGAPQVPPPESLTPIDELQAQWLAEAGQSVSPRLREALGRPWAIEFRPIAPRNPLKPDARPAAQQWWFRSRERMPDAPMLHRCLLAYASDFALIGTALLPHAESWYRPTMIVASIDHALWFHRAARIDEWLLYTMDSPSAQGARGLARGQIYDRAGKLVASVAQEGLVRQVAERKG